MSASKSKKINDNFVEEYRLFLINHLLPLLGMVSNKLENCSAPDSRFNSSVVQAESTLYFGFRGYRMFRIKYENRIPEENLRLSRLILQHFFTIAEYKRFGSAKENSYLSEIHRNIIHGMAIQKGICDWIAWDSKAQKSVDERSREQVEVLFGKLEKWAVKTYEGKKVTLGFILNPTNTVSAPNIYGKWLDFLDDDYIALLTDCIHSVIELDGQCNFLRYRSISEKEAIPYIQLNESIPLRFTQVVQNYVEGKKVGIFLLNNGDIILAKKQKVCFVKRNMRWLNLSYEAFENSLALFVQRTAGETPLRLKSLLKSIFASVLDVSFSHVGGIISIVGGNEWLQDIQETEHQSPVLDPCDNLLNKMSIEELYSTKTKGIESQPCREAVLKEKEIRGRLQKRSVLQALIHGRSFTGVDRKLRSELIGLDGACILDYTGNIYAVGAIIQNDSGSTGGGRGAAAKKLSKYGMAVKISTDGYVELYVDGECVYEIK